jgi:DNA-binding transcriptional MerR regulator
MNTTQLPAERVFSSIEVCQLTGVSYRQLDYWDRTGRVTASHPARGSGTQRLYNEADVQAVMAVGTLREIGFPLHRAFAAAQAIKEAAPAGDLPDERFLVITKDEAIVASSDDELLDATKRGAWVIPLRRVVADMRVWRMARSA